MFVFHTVFEIFSVKQWRDLEIWVCRRSMSLKVVPFESLGTVSYSHSIVTMALSCIIPEIKRVIGRKSRLFVPPAFDAPLAGGWKEYCHTAWCGKTIMMWRLEGEKHYSISLAVSIENLCVTDVHLPTA